MTDANSPAITDKSRDAIGPIRVGFYKEIKRKPLQVKRGANETQADMVDKAIEVIRAELLRADESLSALVITASSSKVRMDTLRAEVYPVFLWVVLVIVVWGGTWLLIATAPK